MAPRSFSDDGAVGATGGGTDTGAIDTSGGPTPPTMNDPGPGSTGTPSNPTSIDGYSTVLNSSGQPIMSGGKTGHGGAALSNDFSAYDWAVMNGDVNNASATNPILPTGFSFSRGGAVPDADGDDDGDTDGSPQQDLMAKALQSVDATLQYSYQKYGLGGGQQEAAAMPARPGTQSEYPGGGTYGPGNYPPPPQKIASAEPMPGWNGGSWEGPTTNGPSPLAPPQQGPVPIQQPDFQPLPPTSNPFGKRSDAGDTGAINTDEDAA